MRVQLLGDAALSRLGVDRILAEYGSPYFKKTRSTVHVPEVVKHISEIKHTFVSSMWSPSIQYQ